MTEAQRTPERLSILVRDEAGAALSNATIEVWSDGALMGSMRSSGRSTVEFERLEALDIRVQFDSYSQTRRARPNEREIVFVVPARRFVELASVPTARCPDGTSGQPCVTCEINRRQIRICA